MRIGKFFTFIAAFFAAGVARAQDNIQGLETIGKPVEGLTGFQPAVTPSMHDIVWLDNMLLVIVSAITLFVMVLMAWVFIRYNKRANPEPARFTHNSVIEVAWTIIPIIILIVIGSFSLPTLFKQLEVPESDLTIKITGNQWYWAYEYVEEGVEFDSYMLGSTATLNYITISDIDPSEITIDRINVAKLKIENIDTSSLADEQFAAYTADPSGFDINDVDLNALTPDDINLETLTLDNIRFSTLVLDDLLFNENTYNFVTEVILNKYGYGRDDWLLATDTTVVVPVNAVVRLQITGADVIHSWTIPAFGVKMDAVPNRLAETWFKAEREGVYFGQCSELCGKDHTYMPITVKVVSQDAYDAWLTGAIAEYASLETMVASAD